MPLGLSNKKFGGYVELLFKTECMKRGLVTATMEFDDYPYDILVKPEGPRDIWSRIQVKGTNSTGSVRLQACTSRRQKKALDSTRVDFLCAYCQAYDLWYIIPSTVITCVTVHLFPQFKNSKGKYESYQEQWGLLTGLTGEVA